MIAISESQVCANLQPRKTNNVGRMMFIPALTQSGNPHKAVMQTSILKSSGSWN